MSGKNKNAPAVIPAKGISTTKPTPPTPAAAPERFIPVAPKINAGNVEYDPSKVDEVLAFFAKQATELPAKEKKTKAAKPNRNIARNIVARLFPSIKVLIAKNYSKKEMYEQFTAQGIAINFAGFSSAINKQIKAEEAAAAAKQLALEGEEAEKHEEPSLKGEGGPTPTPEELADEERLANETHTAE